MVARVKKWVNKLGIRIIPYRKNIISMSLGVIFVLYFIIIAHNSGRVNGFYTMMIFLGFAWIIVSIKIHRLIDILKKLPKVIKIICKVIAVSIAVSFIIISGNIIYNMRITPNEEADYAIVLGCQVVGIYASLPLMQRVFTAVNYLRKNPNTKVIITGGQGPGEDISEAAAMKRLLLERGIDKDRIFEETNAANTMENFKLSNELYDISDKNVVVVTSDYHMYRALLIAKKAGYQNVKGLPSRSQLWVVPVNLLREYLAIVYYKLRGRI